MNIQNTVNIIKQDFLFDHSFFRDNDIATMYLQDFESGASDEGYLLNIDSEYKVLFANESLLSEPYYKRSYLAKMKKSELFDLCEHYEILNYFHSDSTFECNTKEKLIDELMHYVDNEKHYRTHFNESTWRNLDYDLQVNGYCQGDVIKFKFVESRTAKLEYKPNYDYLQNLYFNSPIYCRITVNDLDGNELLEINVDEFVSDSYDFDKSDVIEIIKNNYSSEIYYESLLEYIASNFDNDAEWN